MIRASSIAARALGRTAALAGALLTGHPALAEAPEPAASGRAELADEGGRPPQDRTEPARGEVASTELGAESAARPDPDRAVRIAELRTAIERDRERLMELVSEPEQPGGPPLYQRPELREIAERLPDLESELRAFDEPAASPGKEAR